MTAQHHLHTGQRVATGPHPLVAWVSNDPDRDEPGGLGHADGRHLRRSREPLLDRAETLGYPDVDHQAEVVEPCLPSLEFIEYRQPHRLGSREGDRAALGDELVDGHLWGEQPGMHESASGHESTEDRVDTANVERRQRRPEPIFGRQLEAGSRPARRHVQEGRMAVHTALRACRGAGGVEQDREVIGRTETHRSHHRGQEIDAAVLEQTDRVAASETRSLQGGRDLVGPNPRGATCRAHPLRRLLERPIVGHQPDDW